MSFFLDLHIISSVSGSRIPLFSGDRAFLEEVERFWECFTQFFWDLEQFSRDLEQIYTLLEQFSKIELPHS
ncbi:hypothetical protein [Pseudalkalibacillus sp. R45]|uniref:hypothetical protein n=1 Tax=Pseudalkalibacillus sp. R45 TaxID=3457433 RepID=UPI003FCCA085